MKSRSFRTLAVHAGENDAAHHGAVSVPVYNASVYAFPDADEAAAVHNEEKPGYYYGRLSNPTSEALEQTIAELEAGEHGIAFASGMAAIAGAVMPAVASGDHIVAPRSMYATAMNFLNHLNQKFGVDVTFVDAGNAEEYRAAARQNTKLFWIETPSNPVVRVTDIAAVVSIARELGGITTVADNTFATPYNQRPIDLGVDIVIHSATKYLGGHSDLTAGLLVTSNEEATAIRKTAIKLYGGTIAPQVAWLVLRGIKTLALRMQAHNDNAYALAYMLSQNPKVAAVYYPGLEAHENHEIAKRQMSGGFGGMIGFDLGTVEAGRRFIDGVRLCKRATSLGGVETIVQHSASMTHAAIPREARLAAGIGDGLIRLSVGIEDVDDIASDLEQAIRRI